MVQLSALAEAVHRRRANAQPSRRRRMTIRNECKSVLKTQP